MNVEELQQIAARASARTQGRWYAEPDCGDCWVLFAERGGGLMHPFQLAKCPKRDTQYAEYWPNEADTTFIENSGTDIDALLVHVVELELTVAAQGALLAALQQHAKEACVSRPLTDATIAKLIDLVHSASNLDDDGSLCVYHNNAEWLYTRMREALT